MLFLACVFLVDGLQILSAGGSILLGGLSRWFAVVVLYVIVVFVAPLWVA